MRQALAGNIAASQDVDCALIPSNPLTAISIKSAGVSVGADVVRLYNIPAETATQLPLVLSLPTEPNNDDTFTLVDEDGSAGPTHFVVVLPPAGSGTTVDGGGGFPLNTPRDSQTYIYCAKSNNWDVLPSGAQSIFLQLNSFSTFADVAADDLTTPTAAHLFAILFKVPVQGLWRVSFHIQFALSAPATVTFDVKTVTGVTVFSGGTAGFTGPSGNVEMRYESVADGAITVTGGATATTSTWKAERDATTITSVAADWSETFDAVSVAPGADLAFLVDATASAGNITGIKLYVSAELLTQI